MISFIEGKLCHKQEGMVIVETNGMGFEIGVSNNCLVSLPMVNETCKIFTYLHVKEDGMALYGFADLEEKGLFLKLIEVSGIGPKGAISLLSGMKLSDLLVAIASGDINALSKVKGLGKKTAERICLELKDKVGVAPMFQQDISSVQRSVLEDAVEALLSLGMNKQEANSLASSVIKENDSVEDVVTKVFVKMGR